MQTMEVMISRGPLIVPWDGEIFIKDDLSSCNSSKRTVKASNVSPERKEEVSAVVLYNSVHGKQFLGPPPSWVPRPRAHFLARTPSLTAICLLPPLCLEQIERMTSRLDSSKFYLETDSDNRT